MVVADDLHIVYRVYGAGGDRGTAATVLLRILGRKTRASIREVHAIRGVSFVAYRGDAVGVIGRNGSGKSTLLRAIAGLLPPEQGNVYTTGEASLLGVDEALATGDAEFRVKSHARIEELRHEAGTVFLVAHNLEEVEQTCNRVIWMERGEIVTEGEDVAGIIDRYIAASGGKPVARDSETGQRLSDREHAKA